MQEYKPKPREVAGELLESYLLEQKLRPGDRLPSERDLSKAWGLSRSTLRSALARMEKNGLLCAKRGSGSYLTPPKYTRHLQGLQSLSQSAAEQGRVVTTRLLSIKRVECDKNLARHFNRTLGYLLYKIVRLRRLDGEPVMLETAYIPTERVGNLEKKNLETGSLFKVLEKEYGLIPKKGEEKIGITYATADEAELMGIREDAPLFWIVSQTYDQWGRLMEYCHTAARPDRLRIASVLERRDPATEERRRRPNAK
ncbi:MAG: GntR family transcriptional regulator [Intestinimonas sp.]|jgi:GntR family transcriptional regulator|nr:GntR family transcriptional regulator [Intestinimonas sp.]